MALTPWNPATKVSRGNVALGLVSAIADINSPHLAEVNTGMSLDCAVTTFNGTSSTDSQSIDWLCNPASEQLPGSTTHSIDDLVIKTNGTATDQDLYNALAPNTVVYIWRRDGIPHDTEPAAGQHIWVWKIMVTSVDPVEASNTYVGVTTHITVLARTDLPVIILA